MCVQLGHNRENWTIEHGIEFKPSSRHIVVYVLLYSKNTGRTIITDYKRTNQIDTFVNC